jgi:hypothetical protein
MHRARAARSRGFESLPSLDPDPEPGHLYTSIHVARLEVQKFHTDSQNGIKSPMVSKNGIKNSTSTDPSDVGTFSFLWKINFASILIQRPSNVWSLSFQWIINFRFFGSILGDKASLARAASWKRKIFTKKKPRGNCAIWAFWTAGITARPLAIGSTSLPQYSRYQIEQLGVF